LPYQASPIGRIQHRAVDPLSLADEHLHLDSHTTLVCADSRAEPASLHRRSR
jgi:hypothetical protein